MYRTRTKLRQINFHMNSIKYWVFIALSFFQLEGSAQQLTVSNVLPRTDTKGKIVDAHDGRVAQFGDKFYWYGTAYGTTSGFTKANFFQAYSSSDLNQWKHEGKLLENPPEGVYYRPHVIFNAKAKLYVLWYNWYPKLWDGQIGVAVSKSPTGPFKIKNDNVQLKNSEMGVGDFFLFTDEDGTAYFSYNTIKGHKIYIEKLSSDYLYSTQESSVDIASGCEASALFKREGKYYLLTDKTCCFCGNGTGARYYVSTTPLSGYQYGGNINRHPGTPQLAAVDGEKKGVGRVALNKESFLTVSTPDIHVIDSIKIVVLTESKRTHCDPVNEATIKHPDYSLVPEFNIFRSGTAGMKKINIQKITQTNQNVTESVTLHISPQAMDEVKIQFEKFAFDKVNIAEIEIFSKGENVALSYKGGLSFMAATSSLEEESKNPVIIPAQQTSILQIKTHQGTKFVWMGDMWGSRPDNVKGHDFQYWSDPMEFDENSFIKPLKWKDSWSLSLK